MDSLREEIDCSELQRQVSELEDKLNVAVSENDRLQRAMKELEKWKEKLEKESKSLSLVNSFLNFFIDSLVVRNFKDLISCH